jgi:hypothetical protein
MQVKAAKLDKLDKEESNRTLYEPKGAAWNVVSEPISAPPAISRNATRKSGPTFATAAKGRPPGKAHIFSALVPAGVF